MLKESKFKKRTPGFLFLYLRQGWSKSWLFHEFKSFYPSTIKVQVFSTFLWSKVRYCKKKVEPIFLPHWNLSEEKFQKNYCILIVVDGQGRRLLYKVEIVAVIAIKEAIAAAVVEVTASLNRISNSSSSSWIIMIQKVLTAAVIEVER